MAYKRGFITNVVAKRAGSNLLLAASSGNTEIWVSNVADFSVNGGTLTIEDGTDTILAYTSISPIADYTPGVDPEYKYKITLATPLSANQAVDTPVLVWPPASRKYAYVELGQAGTNIRVEIPFTMSEKFPEGLREVDEREAVAIEQQEGVWQITHVVDEIPMIPGSYIDTEGSGIVTDPQTPPLASPLPQVDAGSGAAVVRWVNAELAIQYDLYVSADNSVAPGPSSLHTINVHSPVWVATMPNGTALPTGSDVYFALVASNALGSAPPSAWVPGRAGVIKDSILSASVAFIQQVITELVQTQGLQIGDHTWNETTGLTIPGVVNFPPDGGDAALAQIWAKMIARSLTVENYLSIRGANNEFGAGSVTKLSIGTGNPTVAPTVASAWPKETVGSLTRQSTYGMVAGDPAWAGSGSRWLVVGGTGKNARVYENGSPVGNTWVPEQNTEIIRYACKGNNCWWIATYIPGDNTQVIVYQVASTLPSASWTRQSFCPVSLRAFSNPDAGPQITVAAPLDASTMPAGGHFGITYATSTGGSATTQYREYTLGAAGTPNTPTQVRSTSFGISDIDGFLYQKAGTDNPYGVPIFYISGSGSGLSSPGGFRVEAVSIGSSSVTSYERYYLSNGMKGKSLTWCKGTDPDGALFCSLTTESSSESPLRVTKYSKYMDWSSHQFYYTWYDNDSGGTGTHETAASPVYQLPAGTDQAFKLARSWMLVTPTPANDLGNADDPNSHRIYCSSTVGGTKRLQGATTLPNGTFQFTYSAASSTVPPATNNFPGSTPAILKSDKTDTAGPIWQLKGDGSGRMGPYVWDTNGLPRDGILNIKERYLPGLVANNVTVGNNAGAVIGGPFSFAILGSDRLVRWKMVSNGYAGSNQAVYHYLEYSVDGGTNYALLDYVYKHNNGTPPMDLGATLDGFFNTPAGADITVWIRYRVLVAGGGPSVLFGHISLSMYRFG